MISFKKIGITVTAAAILMAGTLGGSAFSSTAEAAKLPKADVCHYQAEDELLLDEFGDPVLDEFDDVIVIDAAGWRVINISENALDAHLGVGLEHPGHGDGVFMDDLLANVGTEAECLARNDA